MTFDEALDLIVARTKHERLRWLCSDENPDARGRAIWRRRVMAEAKAKIGDPYPPAAMQIKTAVKAGVEFARSGFKLVDRAEQDRRLAICQGCEHYDRDRLRCRKCGCIGRFKSWLASEKCPLNKWE